MKNLKNLAKFSIIKLLALLKNDIRSKNIYYHDISSSACYTNMSTDINLFKSHIDIIHELGFEIVKKISKPTKQVSISFDDGFRGIFENFDILSDTQTPVTIFLVSNYIGKENYLRKEEIDEMLNTKLLRIGSHTVTHSNLTSIGNNKLIYDELSISRQKLEMLFGVKINSLCFPRGRFSNNIVNLAFNAGYDLLFTSIPGPVNVNDKIQTRYLAQNLKFNQFKSVLKGGSDIFANHYKKLHKI